MVSQLDIEALVNSAQCPTRVESSVAIKNQGLRVGYKWLVKSVIANYLDLGERVARDIQTEKLAEKERREEIRKRIEERRLREEEAEGQTSTGGHGEEFEPPGFVPVETLRAKWAEEEKEEGDIHLVTSPVPSIQPLSASNLVNGKLELELELEPVSGPKKKGLLSKLRPGGGSEVKSLDSRISEESEGERRGPHTGFRNWGLAEELEPTAA